MVVVVVGASLAACSAPVFSDRGVGDASSVPFELRPGSYVISFEAKDREPWFGCTFGVALYATSPDPLAVGQRIGGTDVRTVEPNSTAQGGLAVVVVSEGKYYLQYLGNRPCDWEVSVFR